jgi:hypothetical protein
MAQLANQREQVVISKPPEPVRHAWSGNRRQGPAPRSPSGRPSCPAVTLHAHLPGQNFNGNKVVGNWIGRNNLLGDPIDLVTSPTSTKNVAVPDTRTTGILAATASVVPSTVIARNHISDNHFGIFLEALSNVQKGTNVYGLGTNSFYNVHKAVKAVIVPVS